MANKYTMTEVYDLADRTFGDHGAKVLSYIICSKWGPVWSSEDIDANLVLEDFIKKSVQGLWTYHFYNLIEAPFEDLPVLMGTMGPKGDKIIAWRLGCGK